MPTATLRGFAVCVKGTGFDTVPGKTYRTLEDRTAKRDGWIRVIDECGEDYLYPASWFVAVHPAKASGRRLASALRVVNSER